MFHLRNIQVCNNRYTEDQKNADGRMRAIFSAADADYPDAIDCEPLESEDLKVLRNKINKKLKRAGIICKGVFKVDEDDGETKIDLWNCHLTKQYVDNYGHNVDPITKENTKNLGFYDVVEGADIISEVAKEKGVEAIVSIRDPLTDRKYEFVLPKSTLDIERMFNRHENELVFLDYNEGEIENVRHGSFMDEELGDHIFVRKEFYGSTGKGRLGYWAKKHHKTMRQMGKKPEPSPDEEEQDGDDEQERLRKAKMGIREGFDDGMGEMKSLPDLMREMRKKNKHRRQE